MGFIWSVTGIQKNAKKNGEIGKKFWRAHHGVEGTMDFFLEHRGPTLLGLSEFSLWHLLH